MVLIILDMAIDIFYTDFKNHLFCGRKIPFVIYYKYNYAKEELL